MSPEDAYSIRIVFDPAIYERKVYFTQKWIENGEYRTSIYRFDGVNVERLTVGGHERSPSVQNGDLYYIRYDENRETIMRIRQMGEPIEIASLKKIEKYIFHDDTVLIIGTEDSKPDLPFRATRLNYRFDTRGLIRSRKSLYSFQGTLNKVLSGDFDVVDVASNGKRIVVAVSYRDDDAGLTDLHDFSLGEGLGHKITEGRGIVSSMAISQSGEVAFTGHREGIKPWAVKKLFLQDGKRQIMLGEHTGNGSVISDLFQGSKERMIFDGDRLYCTGQIGGETYLYSVNGDKIQRVSDSGTLQDFAISNGIMCTVTSNSSIPSLLRLGNSTYNPNRDMRFQPAERLASSNVEGWCMINSPSAPNLLFVHGGPHMAYGDAFVIEFQYFFRNGYNVIYCNPRGSAGYGEKFSSGCVEDWGEGPAKDIMDFVDAVIKKYSLTGKFAITGGSYGGYMTNWMITHTDFFSAAISERCVSNLVSMCGTSDIGFWFNAVYMGVNDPWAPESIERMMKHSPISYVKKARTPTLFIHGEQDYRCPIEQAEQMFVGLKMNGVESEMLRYQGDSHEHARAGKPPNMIHRLSAKKEWFDRYLTEAKTVQHDAGSPR